MNKSSFLLILFLLSCASETPETQTTDTSRLNLVIDSTIEQDYVFIDSSQVDAMSIDMDLVSICSEVTPLDGHERFCECHSICCDVQEWYCRPRPDQQIHAKIITVNICNEDMVPCNSDDDASCPPPSILHEGDCDLVYECPPGSSGQFLRWFDCVMEDGTTGRQRILCDKGLIVSGPCQPCVDETCDGLDNDCDERVDEDPIPCEDSCGPGVGLCLGGHIVDCVNREPSEDVCNGIDDDCDGEVDEGQRNACDQCGALPEEICDGQDNDCDGLTDEEMVRECETPCDRGVETCLGGQWVSCTARQPVEEECDGLDNDCDGIPDEGINCLCTRDQVGVLFPCSEEPLVCGIGFKTCECLDVDCELLQMGQCQALCAHIPQPENVECDPFLGRPAPEEVCNNFDDDCDGEIDENLSQACYTGPRNTLNVGICSPGQQTCSSGRWGALDPAGVWTQDLCGGEVVPSEEVCDGADNDCDGQTDYGEEMRPTDVLLIIDTSGSMEGEIRAVTSALSRFGQHFAAEEVIQWGLIVGPTRSPNLAVDGSSLEVLTRVSDIANFNLFFQSFVSLDPDEFDGGLEMHMDAVMLSIRNLAPLHANFVNRRWVNGVVSIPELDQFFINWRQDTDRIVIVFSDEDEQSYMVPEFVNEDLENALNASPNTKMYTFASPFYGWDELAVSSGGRHFDLSNNSQRMYTDLMTILDQVCLPREAQDAQQQEQGAFNRGEKSLYMNVLYSSEFDPVYQRNICLPWVRRER